MNRIRIVLTLIMIAAAAASLSPARAEWVDADGQGLDRALIEGLEINDWWGFALDSDGIPHIAYDSENCPPGIDGCVAYTYYDQCEGWIIPNPPETGGISSRFSDWAIDPIIRIDSRDRPHVLIYLEGSPESVVYLFFNGQAWVGPDGLSIENALLPPDLSYSRFQLDSQDRPHTVSTGGISGNEHIEYRYWDGISWSPLPGMPLEFDPGCGEINQIEMLLDSQDQPHLIFISDSYNLYHIYFHDGSWMTLEGGNSLEPIMVAPLRPHFHTNTVFALDSQDRPHILVSDDGNGAYLIHWNGSEWADSDGAGTESLYVEYPVGRYPRICFGRDDRLYIASHLLMGADGIACIHIEGDRWFNIDGEEGGDPIIPGSEGIGGPVYFELDGAGRPHVNWWDHYFGGVYYVYYSDSETSPTDPTVAVSTERDLYWQCETVELLTEVENLCQGLEKISWVLQGPDPESRTWTFQPVVPPYDPLTIPWPISDLDPGEYECAVEMVSLLGFRATASCTFDVLPGGPPTVSIIGDETYCPGDEIALEIQVDTTPCEKVGEITWRVEGIGSGSETVNCGQEADRVRAELGTPPPGEYTCRVNIVDCDGSVRAGGNHTFTVREWCPKINLWLSPHLTSYYLGQEIRFMLSAAPGESGIGLLNWKWVNEGTGQEGPPESLVADPEVPYTEDLYCPGRGDPGTYHLEATLRTTDWEEVTARTPSFRVVRPRYQNTVRWDKEMGEADWSLGFSPAGPVFLEDGETGFNIYAWGYAAGGINNFQIECNPGESVNPPPVFTAGEKNARWDPGRWELPGNTAPCDLVLTMKYTDSTDGSEKMAVRRLSVVICPVEMLEGKKSSVTEGIRKFRDGFMEKSVEGRELIDDYYRYQREVGLVLLKDPKLAARTADYLKVIQKDLSVMLKYGNPKLSPFAPENLKFISLKNIKEGLELLAGYKKYAAAGLLKMLGEIEKIVIGGKK